MDHTRSSRAKAQTIALRRARALKKEATGR